MHEIYIYYKPYFTNIEAINYKGNDVEFRTLSYPIVKKVIFYKLGRWGAYWITFLL